MAASKMGEKRKRLFPGLARKPASPRHSGWENVSSEA
jgi:hypothetical protein